MSEDRKTALMFTFACMSDTDVIRNHRLVFVENSVRNYDGFLRLFRKYYTNKVCDIVYAIGDVPSKHQDFVLSNDYDVESLVTSDDFYKLGAVFVIMMEGKALEKAVFDSKKEELPVVQEETPN